MYDITKEEYAGYFDPAGALIQHVVEMAHVDAEMHVTDASLNPNGVLVVTVKSAIEFSDGDIPGMRICTNRVTVIEVDVVLVAAKLAEKVSSQGAPPQ